jgi:hypothetical protein
MSGEQKQRKEKRDNKLNPVKGYLDASMKTALRLQDYEDIMPVKDIYALIALTSYFNKHYGQCSKAFIKLETLPDHESSVLDAYQDLALNIFVKYVYPPSAHFICKLHLLYTLTLQYRFTPNDPPTKRKVDCPSCGSAIKEWSTSCQGCGTLFPPCIVTGRPILDNHYAVCKVLIFCGLFIIVLMIFCRCASIKPMSKRYRGSHIVPFVTIVKAGLCSCMCYKLFFSCISGVLVWWVNGGIS